MLEFILLRSLQFTRTFTLSKDLLHMHVGISILSYFLVMQHITSANFSSACRWTYITEYLNLCSIPTNAHRKICLYALFVCYIEINIPLMHWSGTFLVYNWVSNDLRVLKICDTLSYTFNYIIDKLLVLTLWVFICLHTITILDISFFIGLLKKH